MNETNYDVNEQDLKAVKEAAVTEDATTVEPEAVEESRKSGKVNCPRLNVRARASKAGDVITEISDGDRVFIDEKRSNKDWSAVELLDGTKGFCMEQFITVEEQGDCMEESILTSIKSLLGISEDDTFFDKDVILYINSALS